MLLFVCVKYRSRQALNLVRRMARSEGTVGMFGAMPCFTSLHLMTDRDMSCFACRMEVRIFLTSKEEVQPRIPT